MAGATDDFGQGAARALESTAGKADNAIVTTIGGETLIAEWDAGYDGCWVSAIYTAQMIYTEGIICGLVAFIDGRATPETLWSSFINPGEKYAYVAIPSVTLSRDTYRDYLEWVDQYTGCDLFDYPDNNVDYSWTLDFRS